MVTVEAQSAADALGQLPEEERKGAKAVKLVEFTPAQIKQLHSK